MMMNADAKDDGEEEQKGVQQHTKKQEHPQSG
jgi:hypothetical protein